MHCFVLNSFVFRNGNVFSIIVTMHFFLDFYVFFASQDSAAAASNAPQVSMQSSFMCKAHFKHALSCCK